MATKVQEQIEKFIRHDALAMSSMREGSYVSSAKRIGIVTPTHIKKVLKKMWLEGRDLRKDM